MTVRGTLPSEIGWARMEPLWAEPVMGLGEQAEKMRCRWRHCARSRCRLSRCMAKYLADRLATWASGQARGAAHQAGHNPIGRELHCGCLLEFAGRLLRSVIAHLHLQGRQILSSSQQLLSVASRSPLRERRTGMCRQQRPRLPARDGPTSE